MPRKAYFANAGLLILAAACAPLFLSACLYVAYPSVSYAPGVKLEETPEEVHCFRVETEVDDQGLFYNPAFPGSGESVTEIPVSVHGKVNGQLRITVDHGWIRLFDSTVVHHSVRLRLIRPGYEMVEIQSWEFVDHINWKKLDSPQKQEKELDKVLSLKADEYLWLVESTASKSELVNLRDLKPLTKSNGGKKALISLAGCYERLAREYPIGAENDEEIVSRLEDKALRLRLLAEKGVFDEAIKEKPTQKSKEPE